MENFPSDAQIHGHSIMRWFLTIIAFLFFLDSHAQSRLSTDDKKAAKLYEKADKAYRERDFEEALLLLEEAVVRDARFYEAHVRMGNLYQAMGEMDSVYSKLQQYAETAPDPSASILERLAEMALDRGEYNLSDTYLSSFLEKVPDKKQDPTIRLLQGCISFAKEQLRNPTDAVVLQELPAAINRFKLQYLPAITIDQQTIFFTKRDQVQGDEDIAYSYKKDGQWVPAISVSENINTPLNEGACTVSADGRTMIFASCDRRDSFGSCDLFISRKTGDEWSKPKNLGKSINSKYWESQPSLSADGKTLYFSSNRPGGYGKRDIWVSKFEQDQWQEPGNVGQGINSPGDETTPFIHSNGSTLYFSANGYIGMGGYDLYYSNRKDSVWSSPKNLEYPINTFRDEVAIVIAADGRSGLFAKERQKNRQILESTLVAFTLPERIRPPMASYVVGKVTDSETGEALGANIEVTDIRSGESVYESESDQNSGQYYMVLPVGRQLAAYVKSPGYLFKDFSFQTAANSQHRPDTIAIALEKLRAGRSMVLKNIYFDLDSYELDSRSDSELANVEELLKEQSGVVVEIEGHTDNTGAAEYNFQLSRRRALAVYNALLKKGVSPGQLSYKGYGAIKPIESNDSEQGRSANRRIEFRVLRIN